jgi:hypothetical protein
MHAGVGEGKEVLRFGTALRRREKLRHTRRAQVGVNVSFPCQTTCRFLARA